MADTDPTPTTALDAAWEAFLLALWNDLNQDSWKAAYIWHRPIIEAEAREELDAAAELVVRAYALGARKRYAALDTAMPILRAALARQEAPRG